MASRAELSRRPLHRAALTYLFSCRPMALFSQMGKDDQALAAHPPFFCSDDRTASTSSVSAPPDLTSPDGSEQQRKLPSCTACKRSKVSQGARWGAFVCAGIDDDDVTWHVQVRCDRKIPCSRYRAHLPFRPCVSDDVTDAMLGHTQMLPVAVGVRPAAQPSRKAHHPEQASSLASAAASAAAPRLGAGLFARPWLAAPTGGSPAPRAPNSTTSGGGPAETGTAARAL